MMEERSNLHNFSVIPGSSSLC